MSRARSERGDSAEGVEKDSHSVRGAGRTTGERGAAGGGGGGGGGRLGGGGHSIDPALTCTRPLAREVDEKPVKTC